MPRRHRRDTFMALGGPRSSGVASGQPTTSMLPRLFSTDPRSWSLLLLRLALGSVFFPHGAQKVFGWFGGHGFAGTMGYFTGAMGIPAIFAFLAIAAEFAGSLALVAGFFTRLAALGIAG